MKKYLLLLLSIGAASGWVNAQEKMPKHYTPAEKIETLSRIWSELKYNLCRPKKALQDFVQK